MRRKTFRQRGEFVGKPFDVGSGQGGVSGVIPMGAKIGRPIHRVLVFVVGECGLLHMLAFVQCIAVGLNIGFGFFRRYHAFAGQTFCIQPAHARMFGNALIHHRLGEHGVVALVVAKLAVAHQVNHGIFAEFFAVFHRQLHHVAHRFRVVAVHVENRRFHHFGDVGAVYR